MTVQTSIEIIKAVASKIKLHLSDNIASYSQCGLTSDRSMNINDFLKGENRRRGHTYKLFNNRVELNIAKFSFGNRICDQ